MSDELTMELSLPDNTATKRRVKTAVKQKEIANKQPTWEEVWSTGYTTHTGTFKAGILQMKITDTERSRLIEVKHSIEAGEIGAGVEELKKFNKTHALTLYRALVESRKEGIIKKMVEDCPENYILITTENDLYSLEYSLLMEELIALDTETTGLGYFHNDRIVGLSISLDRTDEHYYIPVRHNVEDTQLPAELVFKVLKPMLESTDTAKVLHNATFDYHMLSREGIHLQGIEMDTMIAMHVLNENEESYALKNLATKYGKHFGFEDKSSTYEELFGKGGFQDTPLDIATVYACKDTHLTLKLYKWILEHFEKQPKLKEVYFAEENKVLEVSIQMEQNGFLIDKEFASRYEERLVEQINNLGAQLETEFGGINLDSPSQLSAKIYEDWEVPSNGGRSVDKSTLKELLVKYSSTIPELQSISKLLEYRALKKLLTTYIQPLPLLIGYDGRLHGQFKQAGTATGRYSSNNPNLQNIPLEARKMVIAPEGKLLMGIDLSQIEPRILAHISGDEEFRKPYLTGADLYTTLASKTFGKPLEECGDGSKYRKMMKTGLLATMYGTSTYTLSQQLGIPQENAERFIKDFLSAYPVVANWIAGVHKSVDEIGYVETLMGRKRRFLGHTTVAKRYNTCIAKIKKCCGEVPTDIWKAKKIPYDLKRAYGDCFREYGRVNRQSVNAIIQGTGAHAVKQAMISINEYFKTKGSEWKVLATIHDEVLVEVPDTITPDEVSVIEQCMINSLKLAVPMKVDTEVMIRWGEGVPKREWIAKGCGRRVFE